MSRTPEVKHVTDGILQKLQRTVLQVLPYGPEIELHPALPLNVVRSSRQYNRNHTKRCRKQNRLL
jgi:hypothetical protein